MSRFALLLALLCIGIVWGSTIPITKIVVSTGHQPLGLIFWQLLISAVVLAFVAYARRTPIVLNRKTFLFFFVIATVGTILPNGFSYFAAAQLPAGVMALVIASVPMFALPIALLLGLEKPNLVRLLGVVLGMVAISLLVLPQSSLPDPTKAVFVLIALVAPACYGFEGNYLAIASPPDIGPIRTLLGASALGTVLTLPLALATDTFINPLDGMGVPEFGLIASSLLHIVAYAGYIWIISRAGSVFASQVSYIVTPAGVILSMVFLGESPSGWLWASLALLLVAVTLVRPREETD